MNNLRKDIFMLNKNSIQPLYKQLMDIITSQIKTVPTSRRKNPDRAGAGRALPGQQDHCPTYSGGALYTRYLIKHQGKGTFVKSPMIFRKFESQKNMSFSESCRQNDRIPESHVLSFCKKMRTP